MRIDSGGMGKLESTPKARHDPMLKCRTFGVLVPCKFHPGLIHHAQLFVALYIKADSDCVAIPKCGGTLSVASMELGDLREQSAGRPGHRLEGNRFGEHRRR